MPWCIDTNQQNVVTDAVLSGYQRSRNDARNQI